MKMNEYQILAARTAIYPHRNKPGGMVYVALKLNGEAGEVAEHIGKAIRDDGFGRPIEGTEHLRGLSVARKIALAKEAGDVLWYLAQLASELDMTLEQLAQMNLDKLAARAHRGTLQGSGDDR